MVQRRKPVLTILCSVLSMLFYTPVLEKISGGVLFQFELQSPQEMIIVAAIALAFLTGAGTLFVKNQEKKAVKLAGNAAFVCSVVSLARDLFVCLFWFSVGEGLL